MPFLFPLGPLSGARIASSSYYFLTSKDWGALYRNRLVNLGTTALIAPMGDPREAAGLISQTTFTSRAGSTAAPSTATWTLSAAPNALTVPYNLNPTAAGIYTTAGLAGPSGIPQVRFNGTSELITTPDVAGWTRDDGSSQGFTMIGWVYNSASGNRAVLAKWDGDDTTKEEWMFFFASGVLTLFLHDATANKNASRAANAATSVGLHQVAAVYDGTGGATAANGITIYVDGAAVASTATNDASYVKMRDTSALPTIGGGKSTTTNINFWDSAYFGGPLGPVWMTAQATANQIAEDYKIGRYALGLST